MNKYEEETLILEYFRKQYPDFPKGKVIKSESPDFIIQQTRKITIGIELTRLDENSPTLKGKIGQTISNKNQKLILYQTKKFNEIWLIIHADSITELLPYNIQNKLTIWKYPSKFDKAFLFDLFSNKIYKL